jgi:hypothetical protein
MHAACTDGDHACVYSIRLRKGSDHVSSVSQCRIAIITGLRGTDDARASLLAMYALHKHDVKPGRQHASASVQD